MLKRTPDFTHHVWEAADRIGRNAPRIVDDILKALFPNTVSVAEAEGASRILRIGCIAEVKRVLHRSGNSRALQRPSYFVPERDEEVPVRELIADPAQLDAARRFVRLKSMECLDEAERLDRLYEAVTGQRVTEPADPLRIATVQGADAHRPVPPWEY